MSIRFRIILLFITLFISIRVPGQERMLVWGDEFDYEGLPDPSKWDYENGVIRNYESQVYTMHRLENARVENGLLVIEARKELYDNPLYDESEREIWWKRIQMLQFTSASLFTQYSKTWKYGRLEVRARLPKGRGVWPAIWMMGANYPEVGWPACGEADIMEYVGFKKNQVRGNIHVLPAEGKSSPYGHFSTGSRTRVFRPFKRFYTYAMEWTEEDIRYYIDEDEVLVFTRDNPEASWHFDKPMFLIINLAVGGTLGGRKGINENVFPSRLEIDYVRLYQ